MHMKFYKDGYLRLQRHTNFNAHFEQLDNLL